ncbi:Hypothetical_protein [Hexamita inflata]|uniref:Hypothetical_protein n=1 Tax=Hexamita inflata TaxID=28002 RepID=A0AA86RAJ6_9EUKA|nr:Hypothetical protein HINF_LOCUS62524 [Hexamita inflata]
MLMSQALRQILTEIGIQVTETASDQDLCLQIDQISNIQKRQLKFWDRVSVLCQLSKQQVFTFYSSVYRPNIYTDKLNENDRAAIDEYIRQNLVVIQEASIYETAIQVMNSYFKDRGISLLDIQQYIYLNKSVIPNPSKLLTCALKQVLKEDGHQVETATDKEIYLLVNQITLQQKKHVKFWDRVSVLCEKSKSQTRNWYQKIIHNKKYYKLNDNDKAVIDQHIRQNKIVNINDTVLQIINICFQNRNINMFDVQKYIQKLCNFKAINPKNLAKSNKLKANFDQTHFKLLQALKQILKEVGYQVETASDKELCYHVDQMPQSQKIQYNFWERVSVVCQKSKDQAYGQYSRFKQHIFTDKLNDEDKTAINEYMQQNREIFCDQIVDIMLKTVLKDKNVSLCEVQKYVQLQRQKQFESGLINPQTTQNVLRNQTSLLQLQHQTYNQLSGQSNINDQTNNLIGQIATKSTGNHEYRIKQLSLALKQILREDGYLAETASVNELCLLVDQMPQNDKILLNFWDRVSVLCQQPKETVKKFYYTTYKSTYHQLFSVLGVVSKIESVVRQLQFLQIKLIPDTQDLRQNRFHIPHTDLKCEAKKQRKNEQISNFDFLIMLQIKILSLKRYGGYYSVSYKNLSNNFPCVFEDEFQWSWQLGSWRFHFFQKLNHVWHLSLPGHYDVFTCFLTLPDYTAVQNMLLVWQCYNSLIYMQLEYYQNQYLK